MSHGELITNKGLLFVMSAGRKKNECCQRQQKRVICTVHCRFCFDTPRARDFHTEKTELRTVQDKCMDRELEIKEKQKTGGIGGQTDEPSGQLECKKQQTGTQKEHKLKLREICKERKS